MCNGCDRGQNTSINSTPEDNNAKNQLSFIQQQSILVSRASVSFGHVVGETEGSGSSHYQMSVNHGHPEAHA